MGRFGQQPKGALLQADRNRPQTALSGTGTLAPHHQRNRSSARRRLINDAATPRLVFLLAWLASKKQTGRRDGGRNTAACRSIDRTEYCCGNVAARSVQRGVAGIWGG